MWKRQGRTLSGRDQGCDHLCCPTACRTHHNYLFNDDRRPVFTGDRSRREILVMGACCHVRRLGIGVFNDFDSVGCTASVFQVSQSARTEGRETGIATITGLSSVERQAGRADQETIWSAVRGYASAARSNRSSIGDQTGCRILGSICTGEKCITETGL